MAPGDMAFTVATGLMYTEITFGLLANLFVIAAVVCSGKMRRSAMNLLIANLALSDFLLLLFTAVVYLIQTSTTSLLVFGDWHCTFSIYIRDTCWEATIATFVAIAVER